MSLLESDKEAAEAHGREKAMPVIRSMYPSESRGVMALHFEKSFLAGISYERNRTGAVDAAMDAMCIDYGSASERAEKLFRMKQDDWIEACKEIDALRTELSREKAAKEEALNALRFYADKKNWQERWVDSGGDDDREGDVSDVIDTDDVDVEEDEYGPYMTQGGKRAREVLAKLAPLGQGGGA